MEETTTRIEKLFQQKSQKVLNVYCTAGFPKLESTLEVMRALAENGADLIELGMPYSDPLADGEVIQQSSMVALQNGMTIATLFSQLENFRAQNGEALANTPVILMGYMNPVMQYGFDRFCKKAAEVGVDGLILPDLPMYEYETEYAPVLKKYNLNLIFLVTPETANERVKQLDALSSGFLYAVSSSSTTGNTKEISNQEEYFKKLKTLNLKNPILVGFGIKDKKSFEDACRYSNGAIIGSAYIRALSPSGDVYSQTGAFLKKILS